MGKRKSGAYMVICILFLSMFISACSKKTEVKAGDPYIYCLNSDRTGLVKAAYENTEKDPLKAARAMLKELKKPTEDIEITTPIPKDVKVQESELEGQVLYLDFNGKYLEMPPLEEKLVRAAIVQSIVRIDGISALWFTIDGEDLHNGDGTLAGFLNEDDFVQNTDSSLSSYQTGTLTLYFANEAGDRLVEQELDVRYSSNMSKEKLIVEKLMKGPKKNTGKPTLNPNVSVLGVTIKDGICYVNFDDEFLTGGVDVKPELTIYSIVNSIVEGTTASKVQITINGEKNVSYMDTVDLTQPLQRDMEWVEKTEEE
ncbi:sporulation protein [Clostridium sp. AF19-22AC]|jgi:germination protein M|uniref:Germination protein M n=1 Tax=Faecalicatena orotica TaxID=1544 RepID=A0A2Y9BIK4_9FIRM|nr:MULTISPECIES: GerMN domain-containing protein [Clostridia]PWJ23107.1 germination protein M [Faecalicatena orotica]RHR22861.1 sporulation protein [Clostridium sp. AF19-22AC]SSA57843.1 germination protein M [Faecalicatena orotica]